MAKFPHQLHNYCGDEYLRTKRTTAINLIKASPHVKLVCHRFAKLPFPTCPDAQALTRSAGDTGEAAGTTSTWQWDGGMAAGGTDVTGSPTWTPHGLEE